MQKPEIWKLVLAQLGINKSDPSQNDWRSYITRYIIPEVKQETLRFYGSSDEQPSQESQYPGLDYANPNHCLRLQAFTYHYQLLKAFDRLRLTESEIYTLCKWHGTKKAKDEYERKHRTRIEDTTWEGVHSYESREPSVIVYGGDSTSIGTHYAGDCNMKYEDDELMDGSVNEVDDGMRNHSDASDEESEDGLHQSVGLELNQRLITHAEANAQARARGEEVTMDPEWEQWFKEAAERDAERVAAEGNIASSPASSVTQRLQFQQRQAVRQRQALRLQADYPVARPHNIALASQTSSAAVHAFLNPEALETQGTPLSPTVEGH